MCIYIYICLFIVMYLSRGLAPKYHSHWQYQSSIFLALATFISINNIIHTNTIINLISISIISIINITVSFHNFKSQNFKLSVSNPKSKYVACFVRTVSNFKLPESRPQKQT